MKKMIEEYTDKFPWAPLALLIAGGVMFVLGLFLSASMIKALWLLLGLAALAVGGVSYYLTQMGGKKPAAPKATTPPPAEKEAEDEE